MSLFICCYSEFRYAESHYAECRHALCRYAESHFLFVVMMSVVMLSVIMLNAIMLSVMAHFQMQTNKMGSCLGLVFIFKLDRLGTAHIKYLLYK